MSVKVGPTVCEHCYEVLVIRPLDEVDAALVRTVHEGATPMCRDKAARKRDEERKS